ncbi:MAG: MotA/TolQ/ExbB proton channel family protein [Epsilonproteobacteria bacterium]|nr:MotA/TolQ/ExbB proton channel family protein [Campylobacterota bacterium]NPA56679.1 MotA/TolQ/ExbB proton channel family protein [Campylobacterota bacterium]
MEQFSLITSYLEKSNWITIGILILLSLYFILVNWIFIYRYITLTLWLGREKGSLESLRMGNKRAAMNSYLNRCMIGNKPTQESGDYCIFDATRASTKGLTFLSIAASTSPFIGLFGTVVSILETFYLLGSTKASLSTISASIGEALVATAAGIFVAVFAYSYHLILKRKAYEIISYLKMQIDILLQYR